MINGILAAEELLASRVAFTVRTYPKQIAAAIAALLLCTGGGAFAVASLGPDPSDVPVRRIFEAVAPLPVAAQADALDAYKFTLFRSEVTRSSDTAEALLKRLGIADPAAAAFVRGDARARSALLGTAGRTITAEATDKNKLERLNARWIPNGKGGFDRFVIEHKGDDFVTRTESDELTPATRLASGMVRSSLFAATDDAGIPDAVATQLADIFSGDVDVRQLQKGDRFAVVYETFEADGQAMRTGRVLSAEFENKGKVFQAMWFQEPGKKGAYYRPSGDSLTKSYLEAPLQYSRISSGFAMREHPIAHIWRKHNGIDFAAAKGTPVRTVGDGVVEFAGRQSGYGNIVIVAHRNKESTAYAHLSRIDVKAGQSVSQGQFIGAVGATGWATGPHLHFEFRVDGEYRDPSTLAQHDGGMPITGADRVAFAKVVESSRRNLSAAFSELQASAN